MKIALVIGLLAIALVGLGLPSASAFDGPTPPRLADPVAAGTYNEITVIYFEGAVNGTYMLRFVIPNPTPPPATNTYTTAAIAYNALASAVDSAIETAIPGGSVSVVGDDGTAGGVAPYTVTFSGGGLGGVDIDTEVFNFSSMVDGGGDLVVPIVSGIQQGATTTSADIAPHGGYSSGTDYCLQCHQVHSGRTGNTNGEYALLAELNVTSTCATCHGYLGNNPTGAEDPGFPGQEGTASLRAVYTADPIHNIGYSSSRFDDGWSYGWTFAGGPTGASSRRAGAGVSSTYGGGFYCGTCHTPHGEFGQLINSKWVYTSAATDPDGAGPSTGTPQMYLWEDGTKVFWNDPTTPDEDWQVMELWFDGGAWKVCPNASHTGCSWAQVADSEGQIVSLYGYKLLAYVPNHQYPTRTNGVYLNGTWDPGPDNLLGVPPGTGANGADDISLPPGGMFRDTGYSYGQLVAAAPNPRDLLATRIMLGHLHADADATTGTIHVTEYTRPLDDPTSNIPPDIERQALPFKIRIDDEIIMVTGRSLDSTDADGYRTYSLTVTRNTENVKEPWISPWPPTSTPTAGQAAHNIDADVTLVPTLLIDETNGLNPPGATLPSSGTVLRLPIHVTFSDTGAAGEIAVLQSRTPITGSPGRYLFTVGRAVDGSPQNQSHAGLTTLNAKSGSSVATVKSWGTDIYDHDSAIWCGTCHTYSVDTTFGGQWHNHPTGCTACHGNMGDGGISDDFPHSSTNEFMLQEFPDALCLECHEPGALP